MKDGKYGKREKILAGICGEEFEVAKQNQDKDSADFESALDMIELTGNEGDYSWHSDYYLPEYLSIFLTQASGDAALYFQTRDFVSAFLQDGSPEAKAKAAAAAECINRTLNQRHLQHYQKYMRLQSIRRLSGSVVLRCWWEREDYDAVVGFKKRIIPDERNPWEMREISEPIEQRMPKLDRFNYDVVDPRNVFVSPEYAYTLQDKKYVYVMGEASLDDLEKGADTYGYINLDILKKHEPPKETLVSQNSYNQDKGDQPPDGGHTKGKNSKPYDILYGWKKDWVTVTKRDAVTNEPLEAEPGYDEFGNVKKDAEFEEITFAFAMPDGSSKVLILWHLTPYVDTTGRPFRPLVRGLCFIHPTKDGGMGEAAIARPLQGAINDNFNIGNDRVLLATIPVLKGNKHALEDNDTIEFKPGHVMELYNKDDIDEFRIKDDIMGTIQQSATLKKGMQQALAVYGPQMGDTPAVASTTATAIADAATHASTRGNYSSLTAEYTMWCELYWMILQMTAKFMHPSTGEKLMGDKIADFDPNGDYIYKPLTQSIETESSKASKRKEIAAMLGYIAPIQNPKIAVLVNKLLTRWFESYGDEYEEFRDAMLEENGQSLQPTGNQASPAAMPSSNQNGVAMTPQEIQARGMMNAG
jgi:hypothetical protein